MLSTLFHYVLFGIITELFFSHKYLIISFVMFLNTICAANKQNQQPTIYGHPHTEKTEIWILIWGVLIVVREIATQI